MTKLQQNMLEFDKFIDEVFQGALAAHQHDFMSYCYLDGGSRIVTHVNPQKSTTRRRQALAELLAVVIENTAENPVPAVSTSPP